MSAFKYLALWNKIYIYAGAHGHRPQSLCTAKRKMLREEHCDGNGNDIIFLKCSEIIKISIAQLNNDCRQVFRIRSAEIGNDKPNDRRWRRRRRAMGKSVGRANVSAVCTSFAGKGIIQCERCLISALISSLANLTAFSWCDAYHIHSFVCVSLPLGLFLFGRYYYYYLFIYECLYASNGMTSIHWHRQRHSLFFVGRSNA